VKEKALRSEKQKVWEAFKRLKADYQLEKAKIDAHFFDADGRSTSQV
jgi:hypothetical protein